MSDADSVPTRYSWKGFIQFSLVSIPIKSFNAAISSGERELHQLHEADLQRIRYKKTCPVHGEVPKEEIVCGYEVAKDQYVVVEPDFADAHFNLAEALFAAGREEEARAHWKAYLARDSRRPWSEKARRRLGE